MKKLGIKKITVKSAIPTLGMPMKLHLRKANALSLYSCFREAQQKSQVMTLFRPPMFFPGGATGGAVMELTASMPLHFRNTQKKYGSSIIHGFPKVFTASNEHRMIKHTRPSAHGRFYS